MDDEIILVEEGRFFTSSEIFEFENYYIETIENQQEQIEIMQTGIKFISSLLALIVGLIVIISFLRSVFRHVGS